MGKKKFKKWYFYGFNGIEAGVLIFHFSFVWILIGIYTLKHLPDIVGISIIVAGIIFSLLTWLLYRNVQKKRKKAMEFNEEDDTKTYSYKEKSRLEIRIINYYTERYYVSLILFGVVLPIIFSCFMMTAKYFAPIQLIFLGGALFVIILIAINIYNGKAVAKLDEEKVYDRRKPLIYNDKKDERDSK